MGIAHSRQLFCHGRVTDQALDHKPTELEEWRQASPSIAWCTSARWKRISPSCAATYAVMTLHICPPLIQHRCLGAVTSECKVDEPAVESVPYESGYLPAEARRRAAERSARIPRMHVSSPCHNRIPRTDDRDSEVRVECQHGRHHGELEEKPTITTSPQTRGDHSSPWFRTQLLEPSSPDQWPA